MTAGVETIAAKLHELAPRNFGRHTAEQLVQLAQHSVSSGVALEARSTSLRILCEQLLHTQQNLAHLEAEMGKLLERDAEAKGLQSVPEFGPKTVAVLRAELGDVQRFHRSDQSVAYVGLDLEVRESGKWKGQVKLSKRGSGRLRRVLYLAAVRSVGLKDSAFGAYYHHLVERGMKGRAALMAVMHKMVMVGSHLLRTGQMYDPSKVWAWPVAEPAQPQAMPTPPLPHLVAVGA